MPSPGGRSQLQLHYVGVKAHSFDPLIEVACEDDDHLREILARSAVLTSWSRNGSDPAII
jgi:hypothetical protein